MVTLIFIAPKALFPLLCLDITTLALLFRPLFHMVPENIVEFQP